MMNETDPHSRAQMLNILAEAETASAALAACLIEETRLLREGALKEALALATHKAGLSLAHTRAAHMIRHHAVALHRHAREETLAFRERERALLKEVETNVRLLATLRTALDSVMRGALNAPRGPASPYARPGATPPPQRPEHVLLSVRS